MLHFVLEVVHVPLDFLAFRSVLLKLVCERLTDFLAMLDLLLKNRVFLILELVLSTFLRVLLVL